MKEFELVIKDADGIHARPAGLVVKAAKQFESKCTVVFGEKQCDLRKLLALMGMGIKQNDKITIRVEGPDEDAAAEGVKKAFEDNGLA
jgi:phosphocarrier protein HPr